MMNQNAFAGFSAKGVMRISSAITSAQEEKLEKILQLGWRVAKVYFSRNGSRCALVVKQPGAVGILYANGILHRPAQNAKAITLDTELLERAA